MKIDIRKEAQEIWLALSMECQYTSDYQIRMIEKTRPAGILPVRLSEKEGETTFLYKVTDMISLQQYYRRHALDETEMFWIAETILSVIQQMGRFLLDPDHLILNPSCMFRSEEELFFCYLPIYRKPFRDSFHVLTEYFVRELDYENPNAIQTGCRFHKYTMKVNYDLGRVIEQVRKEVEQQKNISEKALENAELIPEEYENRLTDSVAPDKKERKNSRFRRKKKKMSKWGEWENL